MLSFTHHATIFLSSVYIGIYMDCIAICCYWCMYTRKNEGIGMYACKDQKETPCHLPVCLFSLLFCCTSWLNAVSNDELWQKEKREKWFLIITILLPMMFYFSSLSVFFLWLFLLLQSRFIVLPIKKSIFLLLQ
jgi:hypothetical protein